VVLWFSFAFIFNILRSHVSSFLLPAGMLQFELLTGLSYCNPADEFDNKVHVVGNVYQTLHATT